MNNSRPATGRRATLGTRAQLEEAAGAERAAGDGKAGRRRWPASAGRLPSPTRHHHPVAAVGNLLRDESYESLTTTTTPYR